MKKILLFLAALLIPFSAFAVSISVPSAPTSGYYLVSTSTGAYIATNTPAFATSSSTFLNGTYYLDGLRYPFTCTGINNLIAVIPTGSVIMLPATSTSCTTPILYGPKNISFVGQGASSTIIKTTAGFVGSYVFENTDSTTTGVTIRNLTIDTTASTRVSYIRGIKTSGALIENLTWNGLNLGGGAAIWGLKLGVSDQSAAIPNTDYDSIHNTIRNITITNSDFGTFEGMLLTQFKDFTVSNIYVNHSNTTLAYFVLCYIYCQQGSFDHIYSENNTGNTVGIQQSQEMTISDVHCALGNSDACITNAYSANIVFTGNSASGNTNNTLYKIFDRTVGPDGFSAYIPTSTNLTFTNSVATGTNLVTALTKDATHPLGFKGISITNNQLYNAPSFPIDLGTVNAEGIDYLAISGNAVTSFATGASGFLRITGTTTANITGTHIRVDSNSVVPVTSASNAPFKFNGNMRLDSFSGNMNTPGTGAAATSFANGASTTVSVGNINTAAAGFSINDQNNALIARFVDGCMYLGTTCTASTTGNLSVLGATTGIGLLSFNGSTHIYSLTRQETPSTASLDISAFGGIGFAPNATAGVSTAYSMVLTAAGNLGIGTSTPGTLLSLANPSLSTQNVLVVSTSTATATTTVFAINNVGQALFADGTAALPGISFVNGTNQGLLRVSSTILGVSPNGTNQFQFDQARFYATNAAGPWIANSSGASLTVPVFVPDRAFTGTGFNACIGGTACVIAGSVEQMRWTIGGTGIGTTSPYAWLSVQTLPGANGATTTLFAVASSTATATTTVFNINNTGFVGIGSTTPWSKLSISGGAITVAEKVVSTSTSMVIDWKDGNQQLIQSFTSGVTIAFTNASTTGQKLTLIFCNPAAGTAGAITWSTSIPLDWSGGTPPVQTTTAKKCDAYTFLVTQGTSTAYTNTIFGAAVTGF